MRDKEKENLEVFDLNDNMIAVTGRKRFYNDAKREYAKTKEITKKVKTVRIFLMNSNGRIYLQKRSELKKDNSGLYDKTVGGHVFAGHTWYMTVVRECHEELGFPAVVLTEEEFRTAINATDLRIIGLFREVGYEPEFMSVRKTPKGDFEQPLMNKFYIGYYDGSIRFTDGEASGIEVLTLKNLQGSIKKHPERYTEDLKWMIKEFKHYLVPIKNIITRKRVQD